MSKPLVIIGAGMAGLLAAKMLHHRNPLILEKAEELPNNHSAVLRFRSSIVSDVTGIPFRKVRVIKDVIRGPNQIHDALSYSMKCSGTYLSNRSIPVAAEFGDRFIAPEDMISRMAAGANIVFDVDAFKNDHLLEGADIISTIPMHLLAHRLDYHKPMDFKFNQGFTIRFKVSNCDAYVSLYDPRPQSPFSRISITGDLFIGEIPMDSEGATYDMVSDQGFILDVCNEALRQLGIMRRLTQADKIEVKPQHYSKIIPIDEDDRLDFIHWATDTFSIFSLGRYATWRPGLLLDDLVQDIRLIDKWSGQKSRYKVSAAR